MRQVQPETVVLPALVSVLHTLASRGLAMEKLLEIVQLSASSLHNPDVDARVPTARMVELYDYAARALNDPGLPIRIAEGQRSENLSIVAFIIATASDGASAVRRAGRYLRIAFDTGVDWEVEDRADAIQVRFPLSPKSLASRIQIECGIASFVHHFRTMGQVDVIPNYVTFPHAAPDHTRTHEAFFRCPIRWGEGVAEFEFDRSFADRAVSPKADAKMSEFFQRYADELLEGLKSRAPLRERVKVILERELASGDALSQCVAKQLGMSERSLRRALQGEGVGVRDLIEEVRRERAMALLRGRETTVSDVAYLIGFSDVSAFSRAFKRWTGHSPRQFRTLPS